MISHCKSKQKQHVAVPTPLCDVTHIGALVVPSNVTRYI